MNEKTYENLMVSRGFAPKSFFKKIKENKISYLMLAPYALVFLTFIILPVISAIVLSFTNFNMFEFPRWVGIGNYMRLFLDDDIFLIAIKNTLIFALITGPVGYILSFAVAWFVNELTSGIRAFLTLVFYAPTLVGNVYFIWVFIFSGDSYGFINSRLMMLGILKEPIQWLNDPRYNFYIVMLVMLWLSMGIGFLSFIAGLKMLNKTLNEAAAIDGIRNRWQELWYVTLPQMIPQLLFAAVLSISISFTIGYQCMALTGFPSTDYSTHTMVVHMVDYGSFRFEMGYASAIAVMLFTVMVIAWNFINRVLRKIS